MKIMRGLCVCLLLCSAITAWGYTNPIDNQTTETVTNFWDMGSENLQVGLTTDRNTLIITNGGHVISGGGTLGWDHVSGSHNNQITVTGTGSAWINSGAVTLQTHDNELLITEGGRVDSIGGSVGGGGSYGNNLVTVSGAGSIWSNSAGLSVGTRGFNNGVVITNGGRLYSNGGSVGDQPGSGDLVVTGSGSVYKNAGRLRTYASTLLINDGGMMENTDAWLGFSSATVNGAGSIWLTSGDLDVHVSEIVISDGGRVESKDTKVGHEFGESKVTVTGIGSTWNNTGIFEISGYAPENSVTVSNGGTISTASLALESGTFHLQSGGKLAVSGDFDAAQAGTFDFTGGTLSVGGNLTNLSMLATDCRLEAGDLSGDLTVHGTFAPGQSPADTMLDGAFVLAGDGTIEMELAGYLLGTEYDRLTVTGESMLNGTLSIVLLNDFAPVYGATFDLFNWDGGVSGTFAVTNLPTLENGLFWDTGSLYTDGMVTVVPEPATALSLMLGGLLVTGYRRIKNSYGI